MALDTKQLSDLQNLANNAEWKQIQEVIKPKAPTLQLKDIKAGEITLVSEELEKLAKEASREKSFAERHRTTLIGVGAAAAGAAIGAVAMGILGSGSSSVEEPMMSEGQPGNLRAVK